MSTCLGIAIGCGITIGAAFMKNVPGFAGGIAIVSFWIGYGLGNEGA